MKLNKNLLPWLVIGGYFLLIIPEWSYKKHLLIVFLLVLGVNRCLKSWLESWWIGWLLVMLFNISYAWIFPVEIPSVYNWWKPINYVYSLGLADVMLAPLVFLSITKNWQDWRRSFNWQILFLFFLAIISSIWPGGNYPWYGLWMLIRYWLIWVIARQVLRRETIWGWTTAIMVGFGVINAVLMGGQMIKGGPLGLAVEDKYLAYGRFADETPTLYRPGGLSWNANLTASILLMLIPLAREANLGKMMWIMVWGIILSSSRFVWMAMLVQGWWLLKWGKFKISADKWVNFKHKWLVMVASGLVLLFMGWRMSSLLNFQNVNYRLRHWWLTADVLVKNPLGVGVDNFKYWIVEHYSPEKYDFDSSPQHNWFLEGATSLGITGLLVIGWWVIRVGKEILKRKSLVGLAFLSYIFVNQAYSSWFSVTMTMLAVIILARDEISKEI